VTCGDWGGGGDRTGARSADGEQETSEIVARGAREGVILIPAGTYGNIIRFLPPLVISDAELDEGLDAVERALALVSETTTAARSSSVATT